ncbi:hypothetical protein BD289DRAFT_85309 [Coniella lustricola]|uniref:Uncharacterized protein n=1 Tax=Coniella lustricola TaxID=2025994 RepID=A0A2T2ZYU8_9PEZI|nr:hypothetical protein BD289DRAFT_85309 [Coniella lustricola]
MLHPSKFSVRGRLVMSFLGAAAGGKRKQKLPWVTVEKSIHDSPSRVPPARPMNMGDESRREMWKSARTLRKALLGCWAAGLGGRPLTGPTECSV